MPNRDFVGGDKVKKILFILVVLACAFLLAGCTQQNDSNTAAPQANAPAQPPSNPEPPVQPPAEPPVQPDANVQSPVIPPTGSVSDCTLLSIAEIESVVGIEVKDASHYEYPSSKSCARSWIDLTTSADVSATLTIAEGTADSVKADIAMGCNVMGTATEQIGDYNTCWYEQASAINFGKGVYKMQVQCAGNSCSKEKAIALAKIVVGKV